MVVLGLSSRRATTPLTVFFSLLAMFRQQLHTISKLTTSTLKYASNTVTFFSLSAADDPTIPSSQLIEFWIAETQRGLDAFFDDQFDIAQSIFMQHASESPFHAVGCALMAYVEAMLGFEAEKIQYALDRIAAAESLARQFAKKSRQRHKTSDTDTLSSSTHQTDSDAETDPGTVSISFGSETKEVTDKSHKKRSHHRSPGSIHYDLLETNCMLMSATIQFLRNSWIEYMKAAYKLRKAYKMYEQMFEVLTGHKTSDYAASLRKAKRRQSTTTDAEEVSPNPASPSENSDKFSTCGRSSWTDHKRFSMSRLGHGSRASHDSILSSSVPSSPGNYMRQLHQQTLNQKRRSMTTLELNGSSHARDESIIIEDNTIESGIFFGIGLFSLIFSLLPPKVNKILNTLGFHSSRPFALHLLQKSYTSQGLYSCLSVLTLLAYYTNLSLFIHPQLLPSSLSLASARAMLDQMKARFPSGKIWKLLEGKLCKMEGNTRRGVEILRDARRRDGIRRDLPNGIAYTGSDYTAGTEPRHRKESMVSELAQLQALAVYEMGWGQIFLGEYFQASETFFRLESMNNWSRAFYHYIATCCMFGDGDFDEAAAEFLQIPRILERKRQLGGRLLPNEIFAERKIASWRQKSQNILDGSTLQSAVVVNPLWELIYLWNGIPQLGTSMLDDMRQQLLERLKSSQGPSDKAELQLLLGVVVREQGDYTTSEQYLKSTIQMEEKIVHDRWVIPYAMYELAALRCFHLKDTNHHASIAKEARDWIRRSEQFFHQHQHSSSAFSHGTETVEHGDSDWESRLHVRCQLLLEKLDDVAPA
ncbi:uncharacterized protein BYT42DRAFT_551547 [Radiomyces spectabilis]|uniref:uncharacterized protein n=1 Tax=Radiomyces spectabilis TaxID=64574 RepID=UPI002220A47D|nr:uncharacterized protein BYT42DRAFT_551547 [Radiomyces spectabilis]KAI8393578.1 hypothetical protein BYT42DRAFT_551547 [Radiomyces spectabilis]